MKAIKSMNKHIDKRVHPMWVTSLGPVLRVGRLMYHILFSTDNYLWYMLGFYYFISYFSSSDYQNNEDHNKKKYTKYRLQAKEKPFQGENPKIMFLFL